MTEELEVSLDGALGRIVLKRPRAITALNLTMIEKISEALTGWRDDPAVGAVLVTGDGPKGFCSGGDVRAARALVLEGRESITVVRNLMGPTDGAKAAAGTIRGDYALSKQNNLIHGSDSPESAATEITLWFRPDELVHYQTVDTSWITGSN